jgi:hypothetical protein
LSSSHSSPIDACLSWNKNNSSSPSVWIASADGSNARQVYVMNLDGSAV